MVAAGVPLGVMSASLLGWVNDWTRHHHSNAISAPVVVLGVLLALVAVVWRFKAHLRRIEAR